MPFFCYFENEFHPLDAPLLKTNDLGLLRGYALFDYLRTYNGIPFQLKAYWNRFTQSAKSLNLEVPLTYEEVQEVMAQLYRFSGEAEIAYRLLLTGGYAPDGMTSIKPNFMIRAEPLSRENPVSRRNGIKVIPYEYVRDMPLVKTTNYIHAMVMSQTLREQGASDLLFHKEGRVSELTRSNVFIVKNSEIITPDRDVLKGITRQLVIDKASQLFPVHEKSISLSDFLQADEAFTTSTTKGVMPIVKVGEQVIGDGNLGPISKTLQAVLEEVYKNYGK